MHEPITPILVLEIAASMAITSSAFVAFGAYIWWLF
jgi:hypothetical protein